MKKQTQQEKEIELAAATQDRMIYGTAFLHTDPVTGKVKHLPTCEVEVWTQAPQ